jgi:hypothetical protein
MPQLNVKLVHGNGNRRSDAPHGAFATSTKREVGARGSNDSACAVSPVPCPLSGGWHGQSLAAAAAPV